MQRAMRAGAHADVGATVQREDDLVVAGRLRRPDEVDVREPFGLWGAA